MPKESKKKVTLKPVPDVITEDSVELYSGKKSKQHNIPKSVKDFNKVTPKEAFGAQSRTTKITRNAPKDKTLKVVKQKKK